MEYTDTYLDRIREVGYDADKAGDVFDGYLREYLDNPKLKKKAEERSLRLDAVCASIATLKTNKYLGIEDEDLYDIKRMWRLYDLEYKLVAETLIDNLKAYHLDPAGVPTRDEQDSVEDLEHLKSVLKTLKRGVIIVGAVIVILLAVIGISSYYCAQEFEYSVVEVTVVKETTEEYTEYKYDQNGLRSGERKRSRQVVWVYYDGYDYPLVGVDRSDLYALRNAQYKHEPLTAYLYNGGMYYKEDTMRAYRPCAGVRSYCLFLLVVVLIVFGPTLVLYLTFRIRPGAYHKLRVLTHGRFILRR